MDGVLIAPSDKGLCSIIIFTSKLIRKVHFVTVKRKGLSDNVMSWQQVWHRD